MAEITCNFVDQDTTNEARLIKFNSCRKITYFGKCEVELDILRNCLTTKIKEVDQQNTFFDQIFFQKENFLCVIDEISKNNYIVVFRGKTECEKIFNEIKNNQYNQSNDSVSEDNLFKHNFYLPILKEIQAGIQKSAELRNIILALVNSFEANERREYMDLIFEASLNNSKIIDISTLNESSNLRISHSSTVFSTSMLNDTNQSPYNLRNRSSYGVKREIMENADTAENNSLSRKRQRLPSVNGSMDNTFIDVANYKFVGFFQNGDLVFRLLIFTSHDQKYCYEFLYHRRNDNYYCKKCKHRNATTSVKIHVCEDETVKFKFGRRQHVCRPIEFVAQNYKSNAPPSGNQRLPKIEEGSLNHNGFSTNNRISVKSTWIENISDTLTYEIVEFIQNGALTKRLLLFTSSEKIQCYEYYYRRREDYYHCKKCFRHRSVSIKVFADIDGNMKLKSNGNKHICQPINYLPENYYSVGLIKDEIIEESTDSHQQNFVAPKAEPRLPDFDNILKTSNYQIVETDGTLAKRLFTFTSADKTYCYEFYYNRLKNNYYCKACFRLKRTTIVKIFAENDGIIEYKHGQNQHICKPIKYSPTLNNLSLSHDEQNSTFSTVKSELNSSFAADTVFNTSNFEIVEFLRNGTRAKRLLLFTSAEKTHCYEFYYNLVRNSYYCKKCSQSYRALHVSVKITAETDGNLELKSNGKQHICRPIAYSSENYKDDATMKTIYKPNFSIEECETKNGKKTKQLIIFDSSNAEERFIYAYSNHYDYYYCLKCTKLRKHVQAKLKEDENGEKFIELSNAEHICNKSIVVL